MRLNPGDKVRITKNALENIDVQVIIAAIKDSIGTVLSYEEYADYYTKRYNRKDSWEAAIRCEMENGRSYPVRFDTVAPLSEEAISYYSGYGAVTIECNVGSAEILHVEFLEKIA